MYAANGRKKKWNLIPYLRILEVVCYEFLNRIWGTSLKCKIKKFRSKKINNLKL